MVSEDPSAIECALCQRTEAAVAQLLQDSLSAVVGAGGLRRGRVGEAGWTRRPSSQRWACDTAEEIRMVQIPAAAQLTRDGIIASGSTFQLTLTRPAGRSPSLSNRSFLVAPLSWPPPQDRPAGRFRRGAALSWAAADCLQYRS